MARRYITFEHEVLEDSFGKEALVPMTRFQKALKVIHDCDGGRIRVGGQRFNSWWQTTDRVLDMFWLVDILLGCERYGKVQLATRPASDAVVDAMNNIPNGVLFGGSSWAPRCAQRARALRFLFPNLGEELRLALIKKLDDEGEDDL